MEGDNYVPQQFDDLVKHLELSPGEQKKLRNILRREVKEGRIVKLRNDRYALPRDMELISGKILFRQTGSARLLPIDDKGTILGEAYPVHAEDTWVALHGDRVMCRIKREPSGKFDKGKGGRRSARNRSDSQPFVRVIRILKRASPTMTGELKRSRAAYYVIPDDPRIIPDILVEDPAKSKIKPKPKIGDKVVTQLDPWEQRHLNPTGKIIQVLGKANEPFAEYQAILHKYGLNESFPEKIEQEVKSIPDSVRPRDLANRMDLRDTTVITIDPDDAKDFDDALSLEVLSDGFQRVGIHIADVSAYVKPGSELIKEARTRGNSTYLVGTVIPMLPHKLSNGICSLVEGEDRLTKSVFLYFSSKGKFQKAEFSNSVICSLKRLTYRQALAFLEKDDFNDIRKTPLPPKHQTGATGRDLAQVSNREMKEIMELIRGLWSIAEKLRKRRMDQGSLDLDMDEVKIYVDEKGYADRIETVEYDISHQLIEEFMLAANEAIARSLRNNDIPSLYRVHDSPDEDKLKELEEYMATVGIKTGDLTRKQNVTSLLRTLKKHPQGYSLRIQVLRSLKQACYRNTPDGHYGLHKTNYTHFTSPIRRFSDLVVHQQFDRLLKKLGDSTAPTDSRARNTQKSLGSLGEHLSLTERNSQDAERESVKTKLLEFFERELQKKKKTVFEAIIVDLQNHGLFVELIGSMAYGLIHVSTIRDDIYHLNQEGTALIGRRRKRRFQIGETVSVTVEKVDRYKRQIDFQLFRNNPQKKSSSRKSSSR